MARLGNARCCSPGAVISLLPSLAIWPALAPINTPQTCFHHTLGHDMLKYPKTV